MPNAIGFLGDSGDLNIGNIYYTFLDNNVLKKICLDCSDESVVVCFNTQFFCINFIMPFHSSVVVKFYSISSQDYSSAKYLGVEKKKNKRIINMHSC